MQDDSTPAGSGQRCPFDHGQAAHAASSQRSLEPAGAGAADAGSGAGERPEIVAYSAWGFGVKLIPAYKRRDWMDAASTGFPYACLPMAIANQGGWFVLAPHGCIAEWNGGVRSADILVTIPDPPPLPKVATAGGSWSKAPPGISVQSAVGHGILTWTLSYVFRTPPGWNMLCRGPANWVKDGIAPLEGLIETDWAVSSFSMNWKFTRPGTVRFEKDEPVAMLVPQRRGDLESFSCRKATFAESPALDQGYRAWIESRSAFLASQRAGDPEALRKRFQKDYMRGQTSTGDAGPDEHQKMRELSPFIEPEAP